LFIYALHQGAEFVEYGMTPEVHRLGLHFRNVTTLLFDRADLWIDAYTSEFLYAQLHKSYDLGHMIFRNFSPRIQAKDADQLFTLPSVILRTCHHDS
jgi:hypothetical protein